jgi:FAD/FMN-containing dehydrogenase
MKLMMELIVLGTGEHGVGIGKNEYLVEGLGGEQYS